MRSSPRTGLRSEGFTALPCLQRARSTGAIRSPMANALRRSKRVVLFLSGTRLTEDHFFSVLLRGGSAWLRVNEPYCHTSLCHSDGGRRRP